MFPYIFFLIQLLQPCVTFADNFSHVPVEPTNDYYTGKTFTPPPYRQEFIDHLDAIEIEYLEYFSQLSPTDGKHQNISPCLSKNAQLQRRAPLRNRTYPALLRPNVNLELGLAATQPVYKKFCTPTTLEIRVFYHVVSSSLDAFRSVTPEMIANQVS